MIWANFGTDPSTMAAAFEAGEVDGNYETPAEILAIIDAIGVVTSEIATACTIVARMNVEQAPYGDVRVRWAVQLAVDNAVVLELGVNGAGIVGENHHVGPMHAEYADIGPVTRDVAQSAALLSEAGHTDTELELITNDKAWSANHGKRIAAPHCFEGDTFANALAQRWWVLPGYGWQLSSATRLSSRNSHARRRGLARNS